MILIVLLYRSVLTCLLICFHPVEMKKDFSLSTKDIRIEFIGSLTYQPEPAERCGDDAVAVIYLFDVVKSIGVPIGLDSVHLIVPCPETLGDRFFEVSTKYRIEAIRNPPEQQRYKIVNAAEGAEHGAYWMITIERYD